MIMTTQEMNEMIQKEKGGKENFYVIVFKAIDDAYEHYVLSKLHNSFIGDQDYIDSNIILNDYTLRRSTNSSYKGKPFQVHLYVFPDDCIESISINRLRCIDLKALDGLKEVYLLNEEIVPNEVKQFVNSCNNAIKLRKGLVKSNKKKIKKKDENKHYIIVFEAKNEDISRCVLSTVCNEFIRLQDYIYSSVVINDYKTRKLFDTKPIGNPEDIQVSVFLDELTQSKLIEELITNLDVIKGFFDNIKNIHIINKQYASDEIKSAIDRYNKLIEERDD